MEVLNVYSHGHSHCWFIFSGANAYDLHDLSHHLQFHTFSSSSPSPYSSSSYYYYYALCRRATKYDYFWNMYDYLGVLQKLYCIVTAIFTPSHKKKKIHSGQNEMAFEMDNKCTISLLWHQQNNVCFSEIITYTIFLYCM